jgi:hypothetical protein
MLVPIPADCADEFNVMSGAVPRAYLDPQVRRPMSALALIPDADRADRMRRLRAAPTTASGTDARGTC